MREMPDKAFDLAIVDPPYGDECDLANQSDSRWSVANGFSELWIKNKQSKWNVRPPAEYFEELKRVSKNQIIWGGNYFDLGQTPCYLIWDKGQRDFSFADAELAWTSFETSVRIFTYPRSRLQTETRIHATQKPVALYKWLLTNYAKQGDKILDTHLGSGSSRIAAYDLGFDFTGYELDKDYFNAQEERFARHIAQPQLFEIPRVDPIQEAMFAAA